MTTDLHTLLTPRPAAPSTYGVTIPNGWQQGRGAFGGLVIGGLVRALEASEPEPERQLRSLTAELCGPVVPGPAQITVEVLRRGSGLTTLAARLTQGAEVLAHAVGMLGRTRGEPSRRNYLPMPVLRPWQAVPVTQVQPPLGPPFARFMEMRNTGPAPFSGGTEPFVSGWVRPLEPGVGRGAAYLAACVDAWWPASFSIWSEPRPIGTIAFTLEITGTFEGLDPDAPLFHQARIVAEHDGYLVEMRELWGEDGRLMALNQQTIAIIR